MSMVTFVESATGAICSNGEEISGRLIRIDKEHRRAH